MESGKVNSASGRFLENKESQERSPLLGGHTYDPINYDNSDSRQSSYTRAGSVVYKRRWYILILFSFTALNQAMTWNTWGPIADTAESALPGWTNSDIGLLTNWGPITYVITAVPFSYLMDVKGMRVSVRLIQCMLMFGTAIRCIPVSADHMKWTMNIGQLFIGLAGPVVMAGPPLISVTWFPPHERTTATAISTVFFYFGVAASFLIGPLIVQDVHENNTIVTVSPVLPNNTESLVQGIGDDVTNKEIDQIRHLMYIECGFQGLLFLLSWIYFPARPPLPPSISAGTQRLEFKSGILKLAKYSQFWSVGMAYGITTGVFNAWCSVCVLILSPLGVSQEEAGWIGFWGNIAGAAGGLAIARCVDCIGGHIKAILLVLFSGALMIFGWYLLLCYHVIHFNIIMLYASIIILGLTINGAIPLFYEGAVEATYPVAEGITTISLTWLNNFFIVVFLLILMVPSAAISLLNWCMLGAIIISLPLLILFKEKHNRLAVDLTPHPPD